MARDWFAEAFGAAVSDVRAKLVDEAWFGRSAPEPDPGGDQDWSHDPVLSAKSYPDKIGEAAFLDWLQAEHGREQDDDRRAPEPDHGIDR